MLVKFFQYGAVKKGQKGHSGGGGAVKNYLLGKNFDKGEIREGATLFRGDPNETTSIINGIKRQSYYKSGVLSFTHNDSLKLDDHKLNEIINDFERTLFPIFGEHQYSGYWVKHTDKGRTELHFVYAEEELTSGYALPVYYAKIDRSLVDSWKDLINDKYELDDPNSPDHKRERAITKGFELKKGFEPKYANLTDEQLKDKIHERIFAYAEFMPSIKNRDEIINVFKELGYKVVSKPDSKYVSIEHPNKKDNPKLKNLRFKDGIYSCDFNRSMLLKNMSYEQLEYERKRPERIAKAKKIYDSSLQKRIERMTYRYRNIEHKPLDNKLTEDLEQIQAENEPNFLKELADWQRQELKKIIGKSFDSIYKQHEHDQPEKLVALKNLHETLLDNIDSQIQDEPLTKFDEIIKDYQNQIIEHQQLLIEKERSDAIAKQQYQANVQAMLNELINYNAEPLETKFYQRWQSFDDEALLNEKNIYEEKCKALFDKINRDKVLLTDKELSDFKQYQNVLVTLGGISSIRNHDRKVKNQQKSMLAIRESEKIFEGEAYEKIKALTDVLLEKNTTSNAKRALALEKKATTEVLTQEEIKKYSVIHIVLRTIKAEKEYRIFQRNRQRQLAQEQAQLKKEQAELDKKRRDEEERQKNNHLAFEREMMPLVEQQFNEARKAGIEHSYDFNNYSLHRALKATSNLYKYIEEVKKDELFISFADYKNAIVGKEMEGNIGKLDELAKTGNTGLLEKFKHRSPLGYHYDKDKSVHLQIKQFAIDIARKINNYVTSLVEYAKEKHLIGDDDGDDGIALGGSFKKPQPLLEITQTIDRWLEEQQNNIVKSNQNLKIRQLKR